MKLLLFLLTIGSLQGQITYTISKTTVLSTSAEVITIQQPNSNAKSVNFKGAYIDSTVACSFTIERNGAGATSTTLTPNPLNPDQSSSSAMGFSSSNVGVGTVVTRATVSAGGWLHISLDNAYMSGSGTGKNLTIRTASCTGTVNIVISYTES